VFEAYVFEASYVIEVYVIEAYVIKAHVTEAYLIEVLVHQKTYNWVIRRGSRFYFFWKWFYFFEKKCQV
jgi:hypothetical protein